jgi:hypothetical protein
MCVSYEEENTCVCRQTMGVQIRRYVCVSYEEEDTCVSYEEEDTCVCRYAGTYACMQVRGVGGWGGAVNRPISNGPSFPNSALILRLISHHAVCVCVCVCVCV